jgi:hypothetical protein
MELVVRIVADRWLQAVATRGSNSLNYEKLHHYAFTSRTLCKGCIRTVLDSHISRYVSLNCLHDETKQKDEKHWCQQFKFLVFGHLENTADVCLTRRHEICYLINHENSVNNISRNLEDKLKNLNEEIIPHSMFFFVSLRVISFRLGFHL